MYRSFFILCLVFLPGIVFSQNRSYGYNLQPGDVLIDAGTIRGQFGYTQMKLSEADTFAARTVDAINLKDEFQIFSNFYGYYDRFVIHDGLYTEMLFGKMRNEPIRHGSNDLESKFSVMFRFGYDFLIGYRNPRYGILAGVRPRYAYMFCGDLSMSGSSMGFFLFTMPYAVKAEYHPGFHNEFRILLTAWDNFSNTLPNKGIRLELPVYPGGRWWLFGEYETIQSPVDYVFGINPNKATQTTSSVGIRVGSMY